MKYYKILSHNMIHHGYRYQEGLNVDPNEWVSGECEPGGFYFTTGKHIFEFISYGDLICDVEIYEGAKVEHYDTKSKSDRIIVSNIRSLWDVDVLKELMKDGADVHASLDIAFRFAAEHGYVEIVKFLLQNGADVHVCKDAAIQWSASFGRVEVVKVLLEAGADICGNDNYALIWASESGHAEVVKLLLEAGANVHAYDDLAFQNAVKYGRTEVVRQLIKAGANVHACNDHPLKWAATKEFKEIVQAILEAENDINAFADVIDLLASQYRHLKTVKFLLEKQSCN